jgi:transcriptional regulator with XRE-family HTH domain
MSLGEKISHLRKRSGISQELLAENSRVSLRTIQRIESGDVIPRPHTLKVIADALEITIAELVPITPGEDKQHAALEKLRIVNLWALTGALLPLANIILCFIMWKKYRRLPLVGDAGKRIVSFQIFWTLGTLVVGISAHALLKGFTGSVMIGHFPPVILWVYLVSLAVNSVFVIGAAVQLDKGKYHIYSFVPTLF